MQHRFLPLVVGLLVIKAFFSYGQTVRQFGALPMNSNPGTTLFQGQDGFLYGVLTETYLPLTQEQQNLQELGIGLPKRMGAIYQLSTTGTIRYLHHFQYLEDDPDANATGANPRDLLAMGRDGNLYGLAGNGGVGSGGVFYRLQPDGDYTVLRHCEFFRLPGLYYHEVELDSCRGFFQGPDGAFYTLQSSGLYTGIAPGIIRFGLDGTITSVVQIQLINGFLAQPDPNSDILTVVQYSYQSNPVTVREVRVPNGEIVSERVLQPFPIAAADPRVLAVTSAEIVMYTPRLEDGVNSASRIATINPDGDVTVIAEFMPGDEVDGYPLPSELAHFVAARDGSFYFSGGPQTRGTFGVFGGSRLFHLHRDGTIDFVCDLDGYPLGAIAQGEDDFVYGISWGPHVQVEEAEAILASGEDATALRPMAATRGTQKGIPERKRRGAFSVSTTSNAQRLPLARRDVGRLSRPKAGQPGKVVLSVLQNDRDPEKAGLILAEVESPEHGSVSISEDRRGRTLVEYTAHQIPSRSELLEYRVTDHAGASSTGQIAIRGDVAGLYQTADSSSPDRSLIVRIAPSGRFSAKIRTDTIRTEMAGRLDYSDTASIGRIVRPAHAVKLDLGLSNSPEGTKILNYTLTVDDQTTTGALPRK